MLFAETPRAIYTRNPLAEVICQLRFPAILEIAAEDPAKFQGLVRARYPEYEKEAGVGALPQELKGLLAGLPIALGNEGVVYRFTTEDGGRSIALSQEFVAVSESKYQRWEEFRKEVEVAQQALEDVYSPAFYSRVGLRYRNVISRTALEIAEVDWSELLRPEFAGILAVPDVKHRIRDNKVQILRELDEPSDCYVTIRHGLQPVESGASSYVIDADFFTTEKRRSDDVLTTLDHFHEHTGNFFRWAIAARLAQALGPEPLA